MAPRARLLALAGLPALALGLAPEAHSIGDATKILVEAGLLKDGPGQQLPFEFAAAWSADFVNGATGFSSTGTYFYDSPNSRFRMYQEIDQHIFKPDGKLIVDQLSVSEPMGSKFNQNTTVGRGKDSICKPFEVPYFDPFAFLRMAQPSGTRVVDGVPCTVYRVDEVVKGARIDVAACIAADGAPRELAETTPATRIPASYTFRNVRVGPQDPAAFGPSEACATRYPMPRCPDRGVVELDLYRMHGAHEPLTLKERNLGNAQGDMAFFCALGAARGIVGNLVSRWKVEASTAFGQYGYCLFVGHENKCYGGTGKAVGRESAIGLGEGGFQGQCSPNLDVGDWYSFPKSGMCRHGKRIGYHGCTWTNARRLRTVSARCILEDRGLARACAEEYGHAPFTRSTAIFEAALASADPSKGGCPDAIPPHAENLVVV